MTQDTHHMDNDNAIIDALAAQMTPANAHAARKLLITEPTLRKERGTRKKERFTTWQGQEIRQSFIDIKTRDGILAMRIMADYIAGHWQLSHIETGTPVAARHIRYALGTLQRSLY